MFRVVTHSDSFGKEVHGEFEELEDALKEIGIIVRRRAHDEDNDQVLFDVQYFKTEQEEQEEELEAEEDRKWLEEKEKKDE